MAAHKLDIFEVLRQIDEKNKKYLTTLTSEELATIQPSLLQRWLTGGASAKQIYFINEFVNPYVFPLYKHKQLLWNLCCIAADGKRTRYKWIKPPSRTTTKKPTSIRVIKETYGYSDKDADAAIGCMTLDGILDLAEDLGYQPSDITTIRKEWK